MKRQVWCPTGFITIDAGAEKMWSCVNTWNRLTNMKNKLDWLNLLWNQTYTEHQTVLHLVQNSHTSKIRLCMVRSKFLLLDWQLLCVQPVQKVTSPAWTKVLIWCNLRKCIKCFFFPILETKTSCCWGRWKEMKRGEKEGQVNLFSFPAWKQFKFL